MRTSPSSPRRSQVISALLTVTLSLGAPANGQTPAEPAAALARLPSGITLQYVVQGRSDGKPVVLLHGAGDSWHSYELVLPLLPDRFRVYAVTMRGHGYSDHPSAGYAREDFARDVTQLLELLDLKNVTLVGHSLGSFVAQVVAAGDAGRLSGLVLVGSGPGGPIDEKAVEEIRALFASIRDPVDHGLARDFQASTAHQPLPARFFETMTTEVTRVPARVWHELADSLVHPLTAERLQAIKVPTLVLWGDRDTLLTRKDQDALVSQIPRSRLVVYEATGHALHWERPQRFAADLVAFVDGGSKP